MILFTAALSFVFWGAIKATLGLRVSRDEEIEGLDFGEHGMEAYAGFQTTLSDYTSEGSAATKPAGQFATAPRPTK